MKMKHQRPQVWTAKSGTPAIDCTNDHLMVRENLRVPKLQKTARLKMTDKDRAILETEKAAYRQLKSKFPVLYDEGKTAIIQAFMDSKTPKWGSFKFSGIQI